jgi:hypothetical protein
VQTLWQETWLYEADIPIRDAHATIIMARSGLNALEAEYTVAVVLILKSDALSLANSGESIYVY